MSVVVRKYRRGGWHVDIRILLSDGTPFRERKAFRTASKTAAERWGQERERYLLVNGLPKPTKEVPTLEEFAPRFMDGYARANRQKPSGIAAKETILSRHLIPAVGERKIDAITNEDVQRLKHLLKARAPKTVNNVLTVLNVLLKTAVDWDVIERHPCSIRLLPVPITAAQFHDFDNYDRLVQAAERIGADNYLLVLLGGDAGLRLGEMLALEWSDVDLAKRQLSVARSEWKGQVTTTKGGRVRYVPMTQRLVAALAKHRHLRGKRVIAQPKGDALTMKMIQDRVGDAARSVDARVGVHILRHTFCSHLAMKGVPARAIQELAGHKDLKTTLRYMHLSPGATESAIRLLDASRTSTPFGNMLATGSTENANSSR